MRRLLIFSEVLRYSEHPPHPAPNVLLIVGTEYQGEQRNRKARRKAMVRVKQVAV